MFSIFDKLKKSSPSPQAQGPVEYLIVGLGNPGSQYEATRHNAGFMAIDRLAAKLGVSVNRLKFKSLCGDGMIAGKHCLLMKPSTYMTHSGEAVVEAMNFYKIPIEQVIVVFDDISLEPSHLRIRRKGSDGGHNGIKSILYLTGSDQFPRIKIGVGKKPRPDYNLADWVLSRFTDEEMEKLSPALDSAVKALELMVAGDTDKAMNLYNR